MTRYLAAIAVVVAVVAPTTAGHVARAQSSSRASVQAPPTPGLFHAVDQQAAQLWLRVGVDRATARRGGAVTLIVDVTPRPKMHVYAPGQPGYIPIELTVEHSDLYTAGPIKYPAAVELLLPAIQEKARVYDRPFRLRQPITLASAAQFARLGAASKRIAVAGRLLYQACDDLVCFRPETVKVTWTIAIE